MAVVVRVRIDKATGEVVHFQVDADRSHLPAAEHDALHEQLAAEVGAVLDLFPQIDELRPGRAAPSRTPQTVTPPAETRRTPADPAAEADG